MATAETLPVHVLGPDGEPWATAPDNTWLLRDSQLPEIGVLVEACWSTRFKNPPRYAFERVRLKYCRMPGRSHAQAGTRGG